VGKELLSNWSLKDILENVTKQVEKKAIEKAITLGEGIKTKVVSFLKIDRKTYDKLKD
jgi:Asp-tRNA(Asn)/Glu-tRNA(Gln) amidotransferase B subunit